MKPIYRSLRIATILAMLVALPFESAVVAQEPPAVIDIHVDLSDAPRRIFHARLSMPVQPGSLDLLYPKWLPGEHGPTGPITDLVGLNFSADGKTISWRRDPQEMFAFQVNIPALPSSISNLTICHPATAANSPPGRRLRIGLRS